MRVVESPKTRYVAVGDADVAYQVLGDGPVDLLYFYGLGSHIEVFWGVPEFAEFLQRLASFSRLIFFDRRGTGASDGVARNAIPTWEEWTEDVAAVLDAAGSERAAILAAADAGPIAVLFAAMHPERVSALVLVNSSARYPVDDDYPAGASPDEIDALVNLLGAGWGTPELISIVNPSMAENVEYLEATARMARAAATPRTAAAQYDYIFRSLDVRQLLPLIQVPTLILHSATSPIVPVEHGRYLAEHIEGATFIELPGGDIFAITPNNYVVAVEIAEFLTGERPTVEIERVLTTMLFTDIVASTELAASLGDNRWRSLLDAHDRTVRDQLRRHRGREIKTTGDGFFASFDGPARAIRCAQAIIEATKKLDTTLRVGLHTGEVEVRGDNLGGLAVHIAARVGALAGPGEVLVSSTVKDLVVGSGIEFTDRGEHQLKGVPDTWHIYQVTGPHP
jgi:class 3 adenylate cyclase/pimeloyl-ACP methyl ester carboxylesterase